MNKKIVVFGSFLAVFLMLMIPSVNAIVYHQDENNIIEKQEIYENKKDDQYIQKDFLLPRFRLTFDFGDEGFEIKNIQANKVFHIGENRTIYRGNVIIEGKLNGAEGVAFTKLAGRIYYNFWLLWFLFRNKDPSEILPGFYNLEEEFTIEARIFILRENFTESTPVLGRGYFVRIT